MRAPRCRSDLTSAQSPSLTGTYNSSANSRFWLPVDAREAIGSAAQAVLQVRSLSIPLATLNFTSIFTSPVRLYRRRLVGPQRNVQLLCH